MGFSRICLLAMIISLCACSPKVVTSTLPDKEDLPKKMDAEKIGPCANWFETGHQDEAETEHVIYRDHMRAKRYKEALPHWKKAFELAPMADGNRNTHYEDGIVIYNHFLQKAEDTEEKKEYLKKIMKLYDDLGKCDAKFNPEGRKGFDYFYKYRDFVDDEEIYRLFKASIDKYDIKTDYFVLNPFSALLIQMFVEEKVDLKEAQHYAGKIKEILEHGLATCKNEKECEPWNIINEYAPLRLEEFEGVDGFYDCNYYKEKYYTEFLDNPDDCDVIRTVLARFKWGGCSDEDEKLVEIRNALKEKCVVATEPGPLRQAYDAYQDGKYQEAVTKFLEYVEKTDDPEKKAKYLLIVAKLYYGNLRNFSLSRKYALEAASHKSNWGEPYLLIGKLYASSGPLCGPGRGFDSQRVVWAAIDKFQYAKRIDPEAAEEANQWIRKYAQYMPKKEDLHMMQLSEGSTYTIPCWINEKTIVRGIR